MKVLRCLRPAPSVAVLFVGLAALASACGSENADPVASRSGPGGRSGAECPGDFRASLGEDCLKFGGQGLITTATHPTAQYPGVCMMRPGRTYYVNITHADATGASTCPETELECGRLFATYTP